jgi:Coenzyme PQQ synthesis protein D (PqqD)
MKRKDDYVLQKVGDTCILVPIGAAVAKTNGIITLNKTAARIWRLLESDRTLNELISIVVQEFAVDPKIAQADIEAFVDWLAKMGLLER